MVTVIAQAIQDKKNKSLHWDFLRETCKSFNAELHCNNEVPRQFDIKKTIALRHDQGDPLKYFDLTDIDTILIGCDDNKNDSWMDGCQAVRIETPVNYFLWSGVALGIFLYQYNLEKQTLKHTLLL